MQAFIFTNHRYDSSNRPCKIASAARNLISILPPNQNSEATTFSFISVFILLLQYVTNLTSAKQRNVQASLKVPRILPFSFTAVHVILSFWPHSRSFVFSFYSKASPRQDGMPRNTVDGERNEKKKENYITCNTQNCITSPRDSLRSKIEKGFSQQ